MIQKISEITWTGNFFTFIFIKSENIYKIVDDCEYGQIKWFSQYENYYFLPSCNAVFKKDSLKEIIEFMTEFIEKQINEDVEKVV